MRPSNAILQKIASSAYQPVGAPNLDGFQLVSSTPTLRFYKKEKDIVVGIRGTKPTDTEDLKADAAIALGMLEQTPRYKNDLAALQQFRVQYPPTQYTYYGVGHSLGGAILDAFLKSGLLSSGISYNPAVQPTDFQTPTGNQRIYDENDPLYKLFGRHTPNPEVRKSKAGPLKRLISRIPYVGKLFQSYDAHKLDNFVGGATHRRSFLRKHKLPERSYSLKELAEISGVPKATLQKSYNRGIGAYKTNPLSVRTKGSFKKGVAVPLSQKLSKEQWAFSRVYAFLDGDPKVDADLRGGAKDAFEKQLKEVGISPNDYLSEAKRKARLYTYDPSTLEFARDGVSKLAIQTKEGKRVTFGRVGYNDFLLWSHLEKEGKVPKGTANERRRAYLRRATGIRGEWRKDPYSPNHLAQRILW